MRSEPPSLQLLLAARAWLLDELLPQLAPGERYDALLIASAMAIVARELETASTILEHDRKRDIERLRRFFPEVPERRRQGAEYLRELSARLSRDIRAGKFDQPGPEREALRRYMFEDTVDSLKSCNPKYLEYEGLL